MTTPLLFVGGFKAGDEYPLSPGQVIPTEIRYPTKGGRYVLTKGEYVWRKT